MLYHPSRQIEHRSDALLRLIQPGRYSSPAFATTFSISIRTVSRGVDVRRNPG